MDEERGSGFEQGGEYWKDIPDDILEELYKQLNNPGAQAVEAPEILSNDPFGWQTGAAPSNWGSLRHSGAAPENQFGAPAGFPTPPIKIDPTPLQVQPPPSQQVQAENNQARQTIEQIVNLHNTQEQQIEQMKQLQASLLTQSNPDASKLVQEQQWKLSQQIEAELKELHKLNKSVLLDHTNLHQTRVLAIRLQLQQHRIELLRQELQHLLAHGASKCFAALVITDQPLPQVVFKGKMVEDAYSVLLITAAYQDIQALSKVKATLVSEEHNWKSVSPIENDTAAMDAFQRIALFHNIKVNVSTRMAPVHLKFGVQLQGQRTSQVVESTISYPLIVITNESQWCDAAGKLILADAFAGQAEVSWPQFANAIHHHFLKATRQDPARPSRGLNEADWIYMHSRFFNNSLVVTQQQATAFWTFFGQVACTLRFKRHINSLWFTGLIYGFITKEECNAALLHQELGTFMIRFSESSPGLFAVAYVSDDPNERVKHYLVKHEDISSNKTLPDFLREKPQFQICYQLDPPSGTMRKFARDVLFAPYYSKARKIAKESNGYVLL